MKEIAESIPSILSFLDQGLIFDDANKNLRQY